MNKKLSAKELSLRLLEPYTIPDDCPYLSEDQRELSKLPYEKRMEWMAEWLYMANQCENEDSEDYVWKNSEKNTCST